MIYADNKFLFIHIPRTSGVAITRTYQRFMPEDANYVNVLTGRINNKFWRHSRAIDVMPDLTDWHAIEKFTIVRNPWRIAESMYALLVHTSAEMRAADKCYLKNKQDIIQIQSHVEKDFEHFIFTHYQFMRRGFYSHWACDDDGKPLGIRPFKFENMDKRWPDICKIMGMPTNTPRLQSNQASRKSVQINWTPLAIQFFKQRCAQDLADFKYPDKP